MSPFTLTLIKLAFLAVLWLFVIAAVGVIRADLFGSKAGAAPRPARVKPPKPPRAARAPRNEPRQLVVVQGDRAGTTIQLTGEPITVGRANDATIMVSDDYASSRHARIFAQGGQWIVEDLGSTNGTYLGRNKLTQPTPVPPGVPIRIGKTVIELRK